MKPIFKRILNLTRLEVLLICLLVAVSLKFYEHKKETNLKLDSIENDLVYLNKQHKKADSLLINIYQERILLSIVTGKNINEYNRMHEEPFGHLAEKYSKDEENLGGGE